MTIKTKAAPGTETGAAQESTHPQHSGNGSAAQRVRLLTRLRLGPVSTLQARHELDVLHPAARTMELRRRGFNIVTYWRHECTAKGKLHRVALYVLAGEADAAMFQQGGVS